jgi:catalase
MVAGLLNVDRGMAEAIALGLGMPLPKPLPKVLEREVKPEVTTSPALSLMFRPGTAGVKARRVAILVADGVDGDPLRALARTLTEAGAVPRFIGARLGEVASAAGDPLQVDVPADAAPSVLFDAVVIAEGAAPDGRTLEFIKDQYRHCKPMLVLGDASELLEKAGIPLTLPSGEADPGLLMAPAGRVDAAGFLAAIARHRHFERETDPPLV